MKGGWRDDGEDSDINVTGVYSTWRHHKAGVSTITCFLIFLQTNQAVQNVWQGLRYYKTTLILALIVCLGKLESGAWKVLMGKAMLLGCQAAQQWQKINPQKKILTLSMSGVLERKEHRGNQEIRVVVVALYLFCTLLY